MQKMGFSEQFIPYIKILYQNNISTIINNGFLSAPVKIQRGLRQGCPLSLPLYVVQGEITTVNINKDSTIQGIKIPNKKIDIKLSQYADDSNFFLANQESTENVLKFFHKLHLATGATINLEKTTILPIITDSTLYLQKQLPNVTIKEQHEITKILGILFSENLKEANMTNWQKVLEKIKHHSNKLSQRYLTFSGKATILNTLILAKTTFLSNIFPIPQNVLPKLHKYIFSYIWQNTNVEPISRKTLFLKKEQGGLNIKEPEAHNLAMRLKHLLNLKQHPKQPPWMYLATYWLAKDIYNYSKEFHNLRNNNRAKTTNKESPFYYKDLVQYIKYRNTNITKLKNETKIIYKNILHQGSQNHVIYGETMWKNEIPNSEFTKIWAITYYSYSQPHNRRPIIPITALCYNNK